MRRNATLLALALFAAPVLADEAADLFYRAFWLEQSGGKAAEAEKLYRELIEKHAGAPEAPRAYLALIRMNAARGVATEELVAALEKRYPEAKREIDQARKLAARLRVAFDTKVSADDSPLERKLKTVYGNLLGTGKLALGDQEFLADIGVAGHAMLAAALRSPSADVVYAAANVLVQQKTDAADDVVLASLQDESVLYRLRVLDSMSRRGPMRPRLLAGLDNLWPRASRSMRIRIARIWTEQTRNNPAESKRCFGYVVRALQDESEDVRIEGLLIDTRRPNDIPVAWTKAAIRLLPGTDGRTSAVEAILPWQVRYEEVRPAIEKLLIEREGRIWFRYPNVSELSKFDITDAIIDSWVRIVLQRSAKDPSVLDSNTQDDTKGLLWTAAMASPEAAQRFLRAGLERPDMNILQHVRNGAQRLERDESRLLPEIRQAAVAQWYDEDKKRHEAAREVLGMLSLTKEDLPALLANAKRHPGKGLPGHAKVNSFLAKIGPEAAASLVPFANEDDIYTLFPSGTIFLGSTEGDGIEFFEAILPRAKPMLADFVRQIAGRNARLDMVIARWLLGTRAPEWKWRTSKSMAQSINAGAPPVLIVRGVQDALKSDALRPALYGAVADPRFEIARFALRVAAEDPSDAALAALRAAVDSPWEDLFESAIKALGRRGPQGAAALIAMLDKRKLPDDPRKAEHLRNEVLTQIGNSAGEAQLPFVRARLDARVDGYEASVCWDIAFRLEKEATIERAFREVFGEGPVSFRREALDVLSMTSDERRIAVFRRMLRDQKDAYFVHGVLSTVADQYLVELGPEVLLHLRNPDDSIRRMATMAIERLKFYAEAKKLFDKN